MKNDTLQQLLAKYQQGTLSQDELEELNQLTHKAEVIGAAEGRARTIIRRRTMRAVAFVCAGIAVVGAGVWMLNPAPDAPMVAEVRNESMPQVVEQIDIVESAPAVRNEPATVSMVAQKAERKVEVDQLAVVESEARPEDIALPQSDEPTVICNNQCDADSVINDIWKFLTA